MNVVYYRVLSVKTVVMIFLNAKSFSTINSQTIIQLFFFLGFQIQQAHIYVKNEYSLKTKFPKFMHLQFKL